MPVPSLAQPVQLHRIRFLDHTPSPIAALSFTPLPLPPPRDPSDKGKGKSGVQPKDEFGDLVLARQNGTVEVWSWERESEDGGVGNWSLQKILPPTLTHPSISLMALVLRDPTTTQTVPRLSDVRLFTAGSDSTDLVERCLHTGHVLNTTSIPSPPLWSMSVSPTHTLLCLSSTSPTLSFLSILPGSPLAPPPPHLLKSESLPSRTRTVSIAWAPPNLVKTHDGWEWRDTYLITGNSDSSFRKWDIPLVADGSRPGVSRLVLTGRAVVEKIQKQNRGGRKGGNQKGTIVWGVGVLPDHTIVTSDSLGTVTFWDGQTLAQKQSFQAHKADGMCMVIGPSGRTIFTAGPDQRVGQFTAVPSPSGESWMMTATKRVHSHDIRALAIYPPYTPHASPINPHTAPVLASGGWDMSLTLTPAAPADLLADRLKNPLGKSKGMSRVVFEEAFARKMSFLGGGRGTGRLNVSRAERLVVARKDRGVGIWKVWEEEQGWEKVLDMDLRLRTTLVTTAISHDGRWLAVSDLYETKLFHLTTLPSGTITPRRVKPFLPTLLSSPLLTSLSLETTGTGSSSILFTPDSQRIILGLSHSLHLVVVELPKNSDDQPRVMKCFTRNDMMAGGRVVRVKRRARNAEHRAADDVDMENGQNGQNGHESDDDVPAKDIASAHPGSWIACMAASEDGQWLGVSDLLGRVAIYNLDTLRLHVVLPTLPSSPSAIAFPPAHPSLLTIASPTGTLTFYHIEHRRLLPPAPQLIILNQVLQSSYTPLQSITYEPSRSSHRSAKLVIWSHDWVCTARLDLEVIGRQAGKKGNEAIHTSSMDSGVDSPGLSKSLRKKRAREAREALELVSLSGSSDRPSTPSGLPGLNDSFNGLSNGVGHGVGQWSPGKEPSSATDPEFYKMSLDKFKSVACVEWFGEGEMVVVERPFGDFVGELPAAFWTGSFGRA